MPAVAGVAAALAGYDLFVVSNAKQGLFDRKHLATLVVVVAAFASIATSAPHHSSLYATLEGNAMTVRAESTTSTRRVRISKWTDLVDFYDSVVTAFVGVSWSSTDPEIPPRGALVVTLSEVGYDEAIVETFDAAEGGVFEIPLTMEIFERCPDGSCMEYYDLGVELLAADPSTEVEVVWRMEAELVVDPEDEDDEFTIEIVP